MPSLAATTEAVNGISSKISEIKHFKLEEGAIAYEDSMTPGATVICVPGVGDTRGQFRLLGPLLVKAGYRVIALDPRGQGDSDASFKDYSASKVGDDVIKLIDQLGTDVYLIGNSSGGASAAWAAAHRPQKVKGVVFIAAFLRDHPVGFFNTLLLQAGLRGPWAASSWASYYKSLFVTRPPEDLPSYTDALKESLHLPEHVYALRQLIFASKSDVEKSLKDIKSPVLAIGGSRDPDFKNPDDELNWIVSVMPGKKVLIDGAGHYPHLEYPEQVSELVRAFIPSH